jgi:hypothetical protein
MLATALRGCCTHKRNRRDEGEPQASRAQASSSSPISSSSDDGKASSGASGPKAVSMRSMTDCSTDLSRRSCAGY